jgi:hypothetical protein
VKTAELRHLLRRKYAPAANGTGMPEHLLIWEVPVDGRPRWEGGVPARQRIDAVAVGLWTKTEHLVHGYELKVSRADLNRELKDPTKAQAGIEATDSWSLVLAPDLLRDYDLIPQGWGVLVATKAGLRWKTKPSVTPRPRDPRVVAGLLQASLRSHGVCRGLGYVEGHQRAAALYEKREADRRAWDRRARDLADRDSA